MKSPRPCASPVRIAAKLGLTHKLPLADSVMLATAQVFGATLWTQDADFDGLPGVRYRAKQLKS